MVSPPPDVFWHEWRLRLLYFAYETLGQLRIQELFDIVVDYPDSLPALKDTAACLSHTHLQSTFVSCFQSALRLRLLHAGASAGDIVTQYVATIRALREVDPSGALLSSVAEPIRQYLRGRSDTIHCLVSLVTRDGGGEGGGSLLEELQAANNADAGQAESPGMCEDGDEAALQTCLATASAGASESWTESGKSGAGHPAAAATWHGTKPDDVVDLLIGVFGSTDMFVNEYRSMLAAALLHRTGYNCDAEIRTLELLKIRFGDAPLHACEVMVRDISESKRLDAATASALSAAAAIPGSRSEPSKILHATILSYLFWPQQEEESKASLALVPAIQNAMAAWGRVYRTTKAPRTLKWRPHLGLVELDLEVDDVKVSCRVSPLLATMLQLFEGREAWRANEMAKQLNVPVAVVRRKVMFWLSHAVLVEVREGRRQQGGANPNAEREVVYRRATSLKASLHGAEIVEVGLDEEGPATLPSAADALEEEMAPYEHYILHMLATYRAMSLEKLHGTLRMFLVSHRFDKTLDQLSAFLALLVRRGKVALEGAVYSQAKAPPPQSEN
ncbi:MAG: hypothetical protein WDW36_003946 [Sanguina aurantia]